MLITSVLAFSPIHVAHAMFHQCYVDSGFKATTAEGLSKKITKQTESLGVCYQASFCLARAEGNLKTQQVDYLKSIMVDIDGAGVYSQKYRDIMEIPSPESLNAELTTGNAVEIGTLGLDDIKESGFINFRRTMHDERFFHTVYLQVTKGGKKYLYSTNDMTFTLKLLNGRENSVFKPLGSVQRFLIDGGQGTELTLDGFNKWLKTEGGIGFHFTPVSTVSKNVANSIAVL